MNRPRIAKLFLDVSMCLGHDGLIDIAKKARVNVNELAEGDLLMFINRKGTRLKVLGAQGAVLGYLRMPGNRPLMLEALQYIPQTFGAEGFSYDKACQFALAKRGLVSQEGKWYTTSKPTRSSAHA